MIFLMKKGGLRFGIVTLFLLGLGSCAMTGYRTQDLSQGSPTPIRLVQISDLHLKRKDALYDAVLQRVQDLKPDLLVLTGDMVEKAADLPLLKEFLTKLNPQYPAFAILGNWEYKAGVNHQELRELLKDRGVELLINQDVQLQIHDRWVYLAGVDDYLGGAPDFQFIKSIPERKEVVRLILAHCPILFDLWNQGEHEDPFTMLSGHTHGGQITFFGVSLVTPPGSGSYVKGLYTQGNQRLYVSSGVGTSTIDLRVFMDPVVDLILF